MNSPLEQYAADHRHLLEIVAREAGFEDPVALDVDEFYIPLLKAATRGPVKPVDGVLIRDWDPDNRRHAPGFQIGMRMYRIGDLRFVRIRFHYEERPNLWGLDFLAVDRKDYRRLYKAALIRRRDGEPPSPAPVLPKDQLDLLWKNTIGYLEGTNLDRIRAYGGRAKRGVLLTGAPGNGKTMACRWIWEACRRLRWEHRLVTPDSYRQARAHDSIEELFSVDRRGIVFFDDMDLALRDREKGHESEDQAVFLSALDGIAVHEGIVFVFTTNCSLDLIDRAFKRPGRIDLVMHFKPPDRGLRRRLIERWHGDILKAIDIEHAVETTESFSFAEVEELKNLLVMNFMECAVWDWDWALKQFDINRAELTTRPQRTVGFGSRLGSGRGNGEEIPF